MKKDTIDSIIENNYKVTKVTKSYGLTLALILVSIIVSFAFVFNTMIKSATILEIERMHIELCEE